MSASLQSSLVGLLAVAAGAAGGVLLRYIGSRIALSELRETQRTVREAQQAAAAPTPEGAPAQGFEVSLERIARALELSAEFQRRGWWEQLFTVLSNSAIVAGAVIALVALLRK